MKILVHFSGVSTVNSVSTHLEKLLSKSVRSYLSDFCVCLCLPNAMHSIGQNIKSRKRPSVSRASVDKIVTLFMDRSSPNLEHRFTVSYKRKHF